jgi:hypothetical protein
MPQGNKHITPRWPKGVSGNPSGLPKGVVEMRRLARTHSNEAMERLVQIMRGKSSKLALLASMAILDRAWGKPPQTVTGEQGEGPARIEYIVKWQTDTGDDRFARVVNPKMIDGEAVQ